MSARKQTGSSLLVGSTLASAAILAAVLSLFSAPEVSGGDATRPGENGTWLQLAGASEVERADLLMAMYFPTSLNAQSRSMAPAVLNRSVDPFVSFPATRFYGDNPGIRPPVPIAVPGTLIDTVTLAPPEAPFLGIGREVTRIEPLPVRGAALEVVSLGSGEAVLRSNLTSVQPPEAGRWEPVEFLLQVGPAGMLGTPTVLTSSTVPEIDRFFGNLIVQELRLGVRLSPGDYRVKFGP